ncbi:unnamed protein product [Amoebophrya sp. A120]|nr:unnamed protein product [Amoebophrya sp. A120]|eukprot:GSA120T00006359001.1
MDQSCTGHCQPAQSSTTGPSTTLSGVQGGSCEKNGYPPLAGEEQRQLVFNKSSGSRGSNIVGTNYNPPPSCGNVQLLSSATSAAHVLQTNRSALTDYEQGEILGYGNAVFYYGQNSAAKATGSKLTQMTSFSDDRGDYRGLPGDHLAYRYEILNKPLGKGSFGQVFLVKDHTDDGRGEQESASCEVAAGSSPTPTPGASSLPVSSVATFTSTAMSATGRASSRNKSRCSHEASDKKNKKVACKIIRNKKRFQQQALVEVRILKILKEKMIAQGTSFKPPPIVQMLDHFYFRNHLCITFELLSINLYEFIKSNHFQGVSLNLVRRFAVQLLEGLSFLKSCNVLHCDLKPENILLEKPDKSGIKIIDFGSSCLESERVYTYIQSRYYRSPEVVLGLPYGPPIDMWSLACVLAELYTGYPLFPGENEVEQLACIQECLGPIPGALVEKSPRKKQFFDHQNQPRVVANSRGYKRKPGTKELCLALRSVDPRFTRLVENCLEIDAKDRWTPEDALKSDFITDSSSTKAGSSAFDENRTTSSLTDSAANPPRSSSRRSASTSRRRGFVPFAAAVPAPPAQPSAAGGSSVGAGVVANKCRRREKEEAEAAAAPAGAHEVGSYGVVPAAIDLKTAGIGIIKMPTTEEHQHDTTVVSKNDGSGTTAAREGFFAGPQPLLVNAPLQTNMEQPDKIDTTPCFAGLARGNQLQQAAGTSELHREQELLLQQMKQPVAAQQQQMKQPAAQQTQAVPAGVHQQPSGRNNSSILSRRKGRTRHQSHSRSTRTRSRAGGVEPVGSTMKIHAMNESLVNQRVDDLANIYNNVEHFVGPSRAKTIGGIKTRPHRVTGSSAAATKVTLPLENENLSSKAVPSSSIMTPDFKYEDPVWPSASITFTAGGMQQLHNRTQQKETFRPVDALGQLAKKLQSQEHAFPEKSGHSAALVQQPSANQSHGVVMNHSNINPIDGSLRADILSTARGNKIMVMGLSNSPRRSGPPPPGVNKSNYLIAGHAHWR